MNAELKKTQKSLFGTHHSSDYTNWIKELKSKIRSAQIKAALAANSVLMDFYFDLGRMISEKEAVWGSKFLERLSADLKKEFPDMQGFSVTNLKYCRLFFKYIAIHLQAGDELEKAIGPQAGDELEKAISPQAGDELSFVLESDLYQLIRRLPWGHIKLLISKLKEHQEILFYINQTLENGWGRDMLALQIKSNLYVRQGTAITNFQQTLPAPQSNLAQQTIKDPYTFDFLTMAQPYNERDIENQLIEHITKFLLELGKGFAFVGRQYHLTEILPEELKGSLPTVEEIEADIKIPESESE